MMPAGGWLFGLAFGFVLWMLGPVPLLQWLPDEPILRGYPAAGLLLAQLLWGLAFGLAFPPVHRRLHVRLETEARSTSPMHGTGSSSPGADASASAVTQAPVHPESLRPRNLPTGSGNLCPDAPSNGRDRSLAMQTATVAATDLDGLGDIALVERARNRDGAAAPAHHAAAQPPALRVARGVLHDDAEAEDVVQETYVRAFTHLDGFRGEAQLSTWLTRIALNEALGRLRRRRLPLD